MSFFFFNDTATTEIYTLSLHDALPISAESRADHDPRGAPAAHLSCPAARVRGLPAETTLLRHGPGSLAVATDRKSTRLNSSHANISYAVFCLKKKNDDGEAIDLVLITT